MKRALVIFALLASSVAGQEPVAGSKTLAQYVATLEQIRTMLAANQLAAAKTEATALRGTRIIWSGGTMHADDSLLDAVRNATRADPPLLRRIDTTLAALRRSGAAATGRVDRKLLQRVAAEQNVPELAPGGEVKTKIEADVPLLERVARSIADAFHWIGEKISKFLDWLVDLFPRSSPNRPRARGDVHRIVWVVVTVIVLLIIVLAISVARRSKPGAAVVATSEPFGSKRDEDPLSRGATEWERYAAQLAAAGRYREAIRAWYHAVLVTCYAAGVLHFRKGRTNWEYVASLGPSLPWRPQMIELTRRFEREWYGSDESSREALEDCSGRARAVLAGVRGDVRERGAA
jgi:hypothetical protein